jgi:hypothetical protein
VRSKNVRVVLNPNSVIWADVLAESEVMGFSPSEIVDRALLAQGYGKAVASAALKTGKPATPAAPYPPDQWEDETDAQFGDRRFVEQGLEDNKFRIARVLARYKAHGLDEIVYIEGGREKFLRAAERNTPKK